MILGFSTRINGKETNFIEKIWHSLLFVKGIGVSDWKEYRELYRQKFGSKWDMLECPAPKKHTFRNDKNKRWKVGMIIDFYISVRTKNMFCFAPKVEVKSVQDVSILWSGGDINTCTIYIDRECYVANYSVEYNSSNQRQSKMEELSRNDGFDTVQDFLDYFAENFYGVIIHWTDKKY